MADQNPLSEGLGAFERASTGVKLALVAGVGLAGFLGYRQYKNGQSAGASSGAGLPLSSGDATSQTTAGSSPQSPIYVFVNSGGSGTGAPSTGPTSEGSGGPGILPKLPMGASGGGFAQPLVTRSSVTRPAGGSHVMLPRVYQGTLPTRK